jgi:ubiquinone/menaquinone biosynthesis C-methylase UbiE
MDVPADRRIRFDEAYRGTPPWDLGRPQAAVVRLAAEGALRGPILDVGCGTGDNALHLASLGHEVLGVDFSPRAVERAREKARERGLLVAFEVADALALEALGRTFASVLDSAVFHVFDDPERPRYVASLRRVLPPGGRLAMLVFSEHEPTDWGGPRRVRREEIEHAFADGWAIRSIDRATLETNFPGAGGSGPGRGEAWLARIDRL